MRVNLQTAYVLHTRNYTDTRILVELFTEAHGRLGAVARTAKKSGRFTLLRPFQPLLVSWQGKSDLKTVLDIESGGHLFHLGGVHLYCGMYLNELLLRVLAPADPHPEVYLCYQEALQLLAQGNAVEPVLRSFELDVLAALGYGIPFDVDTETGEPIQPQMFYAFDAASGFTSVAHNVQAMTDSTRARKSFSGEIVLALGQRRFDDPQVLAAAKQLCRAALQPLLGGKPLKSRELFAAP